MPTESLASLLQFLPMIIQSVLFCSPLALCLANGAQDKALLFSILTSTLNLHVSFRNATHLIALCSMLLISIKIIHILSFIFYEPLNDLMNSG